jgi:hypothetical protein
VQLNALTTTQISTLSTRMLNSLTTTQMSQGITTTQIQALTTSQIASLSTTEVKALTTAQLGALSVAQFQNLNLATPLLLDLNGDGVRTRAIDQGVKFDIFGSGDKVQTGWVSKEDGLLVMDRDGDGQITNAGELFGNGTSVAGGKAANGYEALAALDSNKDGAITAADAGFGKLQVWVDANSNGVTDAGELSSLADRNIVSIGVNATATSAKDNGNWVGLAGSYSTGDGGTHATADVWFVADKTASQPSLADGVSGMVEAMAGYADSAAGGTGSGSLAFNPKNSFEGVAKIVDVLGQYDANGNALAPSGQAVTTDETLKLKSLTGSGSGFLVAPVK